MTKLVSLPHHMISGGVEAAVESAAERGFNHGCSHRTPYPLPSSQQEAYLAGFFLARRWVGQLERAE